MTAFYMMVSLLFNILPTVVKCKAQFIRYLPQGVPFLVHLQYLLF